MRMREVQEYARGLREGGENMLGVLAGEADRNGPLTGDQLRKMLAELVRRRGQDAR